MSRRKAAEPEALLAVARRVLAADLEWVRSQPEPNVATVSMHESLLVEIDASLRAAARRK